MQKKIIAIMAIIIAMLLIVFLAVSLSNKNRQAALPPQTSAPIFGDKIGNTRDWVMVYTTGMPFSLKAPKGWYVLPGNTPADFVITNKDDIKNKASDMVLMEIQGSMTKTSGQSTLEYAKANLVHKNAIAEDFGATETGLPIAKFENIKGTPNSGTAYTVDLSPTKFAFIVVEKNGDPNITEQIVQSIFLPKQ